jgi:polyhydroxyalkanoate synthesis regulator phasin
MTAHDFESIVTTLERTASELRSGDLRAEQAAELVDDLARQASQAGAELDLRVRAGDQPLGPAGQLAFGA